jgi:hypothetical protein
MLQGCKETIMNVKCLQLKIKRMRDTINHTLSRIKVLQLLDKRVVLCNIQDNICLRYSLLLVKYNKVTNLRIFMSEPNKLLIIKTSMILWDKYLNIFRLAWPKIFHPRNYEYLNMKKQNFIEHFLVELEN